MKSKGIILLLTAVVFLASCEKIAMHPKPDTDNLSVFNEYSKICVDKFGLQKVKGINLRRLSDSIRPFITPDLSQKELFNYMREITLWMQEGHTSLEALEEGYSANYNWFRGYSSAINSTLTMKYYYGKEANPKAQKLISSESDNEIYYGYLTQDHDIGYIRIPSFTMTVNDYNLEKMMHFLYPAKGIIIDIRENSGGYINFGSRLASYFTNSEVVFGTNYIKNGPGSNDFAASQMKFSPAVSINTFTKPVAVLHDRKTFSTGSSFVIMMNSTGNTTTIGQIFGGGTGEIIDGLLSNGWRYYLSTSNFVDNQGRATDNGIEAEIPMMINPSDTAIDQIIERAILELQ